MMFKKSLFFAASLLALWGAFTLSGCLAGLENLGRVPTNFTEATKQGILEQKYTRMGQYTVASQVFGQGKNNQFTQKIWYPASGGTGKTYPLVVMANGSGSTFANYEAVFAHLASWGFVVIGNDDKSSWNGTSSEESLNFAIGLNGNQNGPLYGKINTQKVGIAGHSQGGVAIINAATLYPISDRYKAIFGASTTKHDLAKNLKWDYDVSKIKAPYFAVSGTGIFDAGKPTETNGGIAPLISMRTNFANIPPDVPQVLARLNKADHGDMVSKPNGYMTAWFIYWLKGDTEAGKAFVAIFVSACGSSDTRPC